MCFIIEIKAKGIERTAQGTVSKSFSGTKAKLVSIRSIDKSHSYYTLADSKGGCSCGLLSDQADWGSPIWSLESDSLADCAKAISHLFLNGATELWIKPLWAGEKPKKKIDISRDEFQKAIMENQIHNFAEYHVT